MRNYLILLTGAFIYLLSHCAYSQQASAPTVELVYQRLAELNTIRQEGLISEDEYIDKNRRLQSLLKMLSQPTPKIIGLGDKSTKGAMQNEVDGNHHQSPAQSSFIKAVEWNNKSFDSANRADWVEAIRTASIAIFLDPSLVPAYINRCRAYLEHGDLDEAMSDCDTALKFEPGTMMAINYRGAIMARLGKVDDALTEYEQACLGGLELGCENYRKIRGYSPNDADAIEGIKVSEAKIKLSQKNWDGAIASASEAIKISPKDTTAYMARSGAYANEGHLTEALADAETAIRQSPDEGLGYNSRGFVYELMNKPRQAILDYEIACSLKAEIGCANLKQFNIEDKPLQTQSLEQSEKPHPVTQLETGSASLTKKLVQGAPTEPTTEPTMVAIPGKNFEIGKYKVTQEQWRTIMGNNLSHFDNCDVSCPAESVSWNDVQEFIQKLNAKTGKQYRLPTEAEWEYACYGGSQTEYCGGNNLDAVGWYNGNSNNQTHPVGQKQANGYGLYDMTGNVWEWTSDCPDKNNCGARSIRGGSWMDAPQYQRAAYRDRGSVEFRNFFIGFRLARTLPKCNDVGLDCLRYIWERLLHDIKE